MKNKQLESIEIFTFVNFFYKQYIFTYLYIILE